MRKPHYLKDQEKAIFRLHRFPSSLLGAVSGIIVMLVIICQCGNVFAQPNLVFHDIGMQNGLSHNTVNHLCVDRQGKLWIATSRGLNVFNGHKMERYLHDEHPELPGNLISRLSCDKQNRIWMKSIDGVVTMLDESRKFHRVSIRDTSGELIANALLLAPDGRMILSTNRGLYALQDQHKMYTDSLTLRDFQRIPVHGYDKPPFVPLGRIYRIDSTRYVYTRDSNAVLLDLRSMQTFKIPSLAGRLPLLAFDSNHLAVYDRKQKQVVRIQMQTGEISYPFQSIRDQNGKPITAEFTGAGQFNENEFVFTTDGDGIYIYNRHQATMIQYAHDVYNPYSISNNSQFNVLVAPNGWVFFICNPSGISYYNRFETVQSQHVFSDKKGQLFDGYVSAIATEDNNTYYIGTAKGLMQWKRNTNTTRFINFVGSDGEPLLKQEEVQSVLIDKQHRIWASTTTQGILVMDAQLNLLRHFRSGNGPDQIKLSTARMLQMSPDGDIWACGEFGLCKIDPLQMKVDNLIDTILSQFDQSFCYPIHFQGKDKLWFVARDKGLQQYHLRTHQLTTYTRDNGLLHLTVFAINSDRYNNVYIGSLGGMNILTATDKMHSVTSNEGLLHNRVEGILFDRHQRIWIANDIGLICYTQDGKRFRTFDERNGLSEYGFRVDAMLVAPNGEFILGTTKGIQYFDPDSLFHRRSPLKAIIHHFRSREKDEGVHGNGSFSLSPHDNSLTFSFESIEFNRHVRTYYRYMLEGADKDWIKVTDQNSVTYHGLSPGNYLFRLQVSHNGLVWQPALNTVNVFLAPPFYQTILFMVLAAMSFILISIYIVHYLRKQQIEKRNTLETELVITYFASQINSHKNAELLLWDIAKNCISRLHFHECIIYLINEQGTTLIQKAAYGPKNPEGYIIDQPLEIPVGKGITGTVAQTGVAEIVNNTSEDPRYIVDDVRRFSEMAIPILVDNRVIGVIDSEHPKRNFFTLRHKQIMETIAFLCANQLQKIRADEEKQFATIELLKNKQKAAESRLQSLRLQMNPHFLFNALNSIQQMILADEDVVATRYLSRFSKLLRAILVYSDREFISLKEEIDILRMYIELESIRFKDAFSFIIHCHEDIEMEEINIPTLLIQPFVENAIWHGLMHKEDNRKLSIIFTEQEDYLKCVVEDNGIGRVAARQTNSSSGRDNKHTSKGIAVSEERLKTNTNRSGKTGSITITDLYDDKGNASGTRVTILFAI
jgi:ligand-binding sensor domain-containing protein/putative methionine-R-sulfoxide reductase with GAF domain